jgi:PAS domain S-box-containing protein
MLPDIPVIISPHSSIGLAILAIEDNHTDALIVIEGDQLLGIFTRKDLSRIISRVLKLGTNLDNFLANTNLSEVIKSKVVTISASEQSNISLIRQLQRSHNISHLPVVDQKGYPIGIFQLEQLSDRLHNDLEEKYVQQKMAYAKLEKESANLRLATELNQIGCWRLNLSNRQADWNDINFQLLGLPINRKNLNYFTWRDRIHPEDRELVEREFCESISSNQELEVRHRIIRPNGEEIWVLTRGKPLYDDFGQPVSMIGVMVDINDAHRIRLALQQKEKQNLALIRERELLLRNERNARESTEIANQEWYEILESITEGFMGVNREWQITHVNSAMSILTQRPTTELVGRSFWKIFPECQQNQFGFTYQRGMDSREYQEFEGFHPSFELWLQVRVFPSSLGLSIFAKDLSEARRLEIERNRIFEYSRGIMAITDQSGILLQINPAWQEILGYKIKDSLGRSFLDFIHEEDKEMTIEHMKVMAKNSIPAINFEMRYCDQNGKIVWLTWDCIPFPDEQKIYGFGRDITLRKIAQHELQELNFKLEAIVTERTSQLEASENRNRAMLNAIPDLLILLKSDGTCLDLVMPYDSTISEYLPIKKDIAEILGDHNLPSLLSAFQQAIASEQVQIYEQQVIKEDNTTYEEVRISPCGLDELLVVVRDISDRKAVENLIAQKEAYLKAIVQIQNIFLAFPFVQALPQILKILGEVTNSSRAYIFKNSSDINNQIVTGQIAEWCAPNVLPECDNPDLQNISCGEDADPWLKILAQGKYFSLLVTEISEDEKLALEKQPVKSVLAFPLRTQTEWWGFFGFDQCDFPREWSESEISLLQAAASGIELAIERQISDQSWLEVNKQLSQNIKFTQRITDAVPSLLYIFDLENQTITYLNRELGEALGYVKGEFRMNEKEIIEKQIHPDDLIRLQSHFSQIENSVDSQIQSLEYRIQAKNGEWIWFLSQDRVFSRDADHKVNQIMGTATNISSLKTAEHKLQRSLAEKEILLKEVHHRVKNNLNVIDGLLNLQIHSLEDNLLKQLLQDSRQRIATMGLVHQQLYQTERLNQVNFAEYIQSLCQNLYQVYVLQPDLIEMEVKTEPVMVNVDIAIPAGLILNELLTNVFKHAFPNSMAGKVIVEFYQDDRENLHLWVKDNGKGMVPSNRQSSTSLGIELIKILAQQLRATVEFESTPNIQVGTIVHLFLPDTKN